MTTSESKGRFFTKRIDSHNESNGIYSNRELECSNQRVGWLGSRVVSVLDLGAVGPGFKSQSRRGRVTVVGKLFTPIVPLSLGYLYVFLLSA